ncbi:MAG TPA: YXWGXW repeat-containing protein [Candidatus Cybelea sp.]|nr:YXWGXW repeat-containing protein [Candidatus Cybelea sp.]
MNKSKLLKPVFALSVGAMCLAGCTVRETAYQTPGGTVAESEIDVTGPPPAPLVDDVTVSPGPGFVWIGGAWAWVGGRWEWERGRWDHRPHAGAVWVPHHYEFHNGRHVFTRGHWK